MGKDKVLPDIDGNMVIASCENCDHLHDDSDGYEYGYQNLTCTKIGREHVSNLKSFPFKTGQSCCDLHHAFTVDWPEFDRETELTWYGRIDSIDQSWR